MAVGSRDRTEYCELKSWLTKSSPSLITRCIQAPVVIRTQRRERCMRNEKKVHRPLFEVEPTIKTYKVMWRTGDFVERPNQG